MGINFQPTHKGSPWEKGTVETQFQRGRHPVRPVCRRLRRLQRRAPRREGRADAVWSIAELQALLDEWIVTTWQNRPHDGLRHPVTPDKALTPNEQYAALVEVAGYVPVPLSADDYVELLPVSWHAINNYGIKINNRTYDCKALNPYRRQHSGVDAQEGAVGGASRPLRRHPGLGPQPPRRRVDHRCLEAPAHQPRPRSASWPGSTPAQVLARRGQDPATEAEIAHAAAALLDKAEHGPDRPGQTATSEGSRAAGRTRATNIGPPDRGLRHHPTTSRQPAASARRARGRRGRRRRSSRWRSSTPARRPRKWW